VITAGRTGAGPGTVAYSVAANPAADPRSGTLTIEDQRHTIAQTGRDPNTCGGATQDRCTWTARADVEWITVTTSMPRTGDDRVAFSFAANEASASRVGRITVKDKVVVISQAGR
jgi:hypothetical protein